MDRHIAEESPKVSLEKPALSHDRTGVNFLARFSSNSAATTVKVVARFLDLHRTLDAH